LISTGEEKREKKREKQQQQQQQQQQQPVPPDLKNSNLLFGLFYNRNLLCHLNILKENYFIYQL